MPLLEGIDPWGLAVALALPWLTGSLLVAVVLRRASPALVVGHGFMAGQVMVALVLLLCDAAGLRLSFMPTAAILVGIAVGLAVVFWRRAGLGRPPRPSRRMLLSLLWLVPLAAFLLERGGVLAQELALRPLYAWDAWMNWVPRAVVWYHYEWLVPFVMPPDWLAAAPEETVYTLGNWRAGDYPPGIPLLLLWQMLGAGTADHTLLYLPWLLLPASFALALWGHLRRHGLVAAAAALAVFAWLSQPFVNTHAVLAGYADLWLAIAFSLGAMALAEWQRGGERGFVLLAAVMALACVLFKTPGLAFASMLALGAAVLAVRPSSRWVWRIAVACAVVLLAGLLLAMHAGVRGLVGDGLAIPLPAPLPVLRLELGPLLPYLWESLFVHANWHLSWLLIAFAVITAALLRGRPAFENVAVGLLALALGFLLGLFGFTHYFAQAENGVTFNRTLLYLAPLGVFVAFMLLAPWLGGERLERDEAA